MAVGWIKGGSAYRGEKILRLLALLLGGNGELLDPLGERHDLRLRRVGVGGDHTHKLVGQGPMTISARCEPCDVTHNRAMKPEICHMGNQACAKGSLIAISDYQ